MTVGRTNFHGERRTEELVAKKPALKETLKKKHFGNLILFFGHELLVCPFIMEICMILAH
uniref:Uncharacterized protein n=1 Tax=Aegilops tauschii subsp. strangulata TaxID=200361 RepID=A0A453I1K7_AEGTS